MPSGLDPSCWPPEVGKLLPSPDRLEVVPRPCTGCAGREQCVVVGVDVGNSGGAGTAGPVTWATVPGQESSGTGVRAWVDEVPVATRLAGARRVRLPDPGGVALVKAVDRDQQYVAGLGLPDLRALALCLCRGQRNEPRCDDGSTGPRNSGATFAMRHEE